MFQRSNSLCLVVLAIFSSGVIAELTPDDYMSFLSIPPYRSFSKFPKPDMVTPDMDLQLQQIASQYHLDVADLYQLYAIMQSEGVAPDESLSMVGKLAPQIHYDKMDRMFNLPYPTFMQKFMPQMQAPGLPNVRLYKREPAEGLAEAIVDDTASNMKSAYRGMKNGLDKAYDNVMNFANRMAPQTTEAMRNVVDSLVGYSGQPSLSDKLQSNMRYMMADY